MSEQAKLPERMNDHGGFPRGALAALGFTVRQLLLVAGAVGAYFGVRGLTERNAGIAERNADVLLRLEGVLGIAVEEAVQQAVYWSDASVTMANWVYIWLHWPLIIGTLVWLAITRRPAYIELRNALFISGAIGLIIFATIPVAPPRLFAPEYLDTVTLRSQAYRVLQPPAFVNKYAALPSFHFGWNLLVGIACFRYGCSRWLKAAGLAMPAAMGWAVVATGNHWVLDVLAGGTIALGGLAIERRRAANRLGRERAADHAPTPDE